MGMRVSVLESNEKRTDKAIDEVKAKIDLIESELKTIGSDVSKILGKLG